MTTPKRMVLLRCWTLFGGRYGDIQKKFQVIWRYWIRYLSSKISENVTKSAKNAATIWKKINTTLFIQLGVPHISNLVTDSVILTLSCWPTHPPPVSANQKFLYIESHAIWLAPKWGWQGDFWPFFLVICGYLKKNLGNMLITNWISDLENWW